MRPAGSESIAYGTGAASEAVNSAGVVTGSPQVKFWHTNANGSFPDGLSRSNATDSSAPEGESLRRIATTLFGRRR